MTLALLPLTRAQIAFWNTVLYDHRNSERYGCAICGVPDCSKQMEARASLAMAGEIDWDPLRERAIAEGRAS